MNNPLDQKDDNPPQGRHPVDSPGTKTFNTISNKKHRSFSLIVDSSPCPKFVPGRTLTIISAEGIFPQSYPPESWIDDKIGLINPDLSGGRRIFNVSVSRHPRFIAYTTIITKKQNPKIIHALAEAIREP
ncbi:MAG: hypothetical protein V1793_01990 [Pseudomonadota bacterium]